MHLSWPSNTRVEQIYEVPVSCLQELLRVNTISSGTREYLGEGTGCQHTGEKLGNYWVSRCNQKFCIRL